MILQSVISLAHSLWLTALFPGARVIDATCGNGQDSLFLAQTALEGSSGQLLAFDIQKKALQSTKKLLENHLSEKQLSQVEYVHCCHSKINLYCNQPVDLIIFNLGYLPGSDKSLTTLSATTLEALGQSLDLLKPTGLLSITCYPGHEEGAKEALVVNKWAEHLGRGFNCCVHSWPNRTCSAPFLITVQIRSC